MTELEKAASGLLYDANSDPALLEAAYAANVLVVGPATVMSVLKYAEI